MLLDVEGHEAGRTGRAPVWWRRSPLRQPADVDPHGTDKAGVAAAAALFDRPDLEDHYAVAATPSVAPEPLPVGGS